MLSPLQIGWALQVGALIGLVLALMGDDMPLQFYRRWLDRFYHAGPEWIAWISKPLGLCSFCASFWWGILSGAALSLTPVHIVLFGAITWALNQKIFKG